jgi:non-homologous end joining protein Ku
VKQKVKAGKTAVIDDEEPETPKTPAEVYDLMPLLKKSLASGAGRPKAAAAGGKKKAKKRATPARAAKAKSRRSA